MLTGVSLRTSNSATSLFNEDIAPVAKARRTWGFWAYVSFYSIANINPTTWSAAVSLLTLGLSFGETLGCIVIGNVLITVAFFFVNAPGYDQHIGYTTVMRMVFGIKGSYLGVLIRIILSVVWYGSTAWLGGLFLGNILSSWSEHYFLLPNTMSSTVTTKDFTGFVVFQIIQMPFFYFRPERLAPMVHVGCITSFLSIVSLLIWSTVSARGHGPLNTAELSSMTSSERGWAWVAGITGWYGSLITMIVNSSDFTRFSNTPTTSWGGNLIGTMLWGTVIPIMGIVTASTFQKLFNENIITPSAVLEKILSQNYNAGSRCAVFFCALGFLIGQFPVNVVNNGISGGTDMAGMFPKYISIRRGCIITSLLSWVVFPWTYYNSQSTFYSVIISFSVFLSPLTAIIVHDYWLVYHRNAPIDDLYSSDQSGSYFFFKGFHLQNILSWIIGFLPGMIGMIKSQRPDAAISKGIYKYYDGNSLFGFAISFATCLILNYISPIKSGERRARSAVCTVSNELTESNRSKKFEV